MTWNAVKRLCGIFCCPPCPARIAAKLAFMPPPPTYAVIDDISADGVVKKKLELTEEAEWQFTQRELDCIEPFMTRTSRGETIACIYIHCYPNAKYTILFRYLLYLLLIFWIFKYHSEACCTDSSDDIRKQGLHHILHILLSVDNNIKAKSNAAVNTAAVMGVIY